MFKEYKITFLVVLYSTHILQSSVEDKKNTSVAKQIIEKLDEIYAIKNTKIEKLDITKKNLNSLNIETDILMHDNGTLTTLESIYFELLNKKEFHIKNILNYPTIKKNNLISELSVIANLKLLETKKNSIHAITTLINEADIALSGQLDKANKDLTSLIDKTNNTLTEKLNKTKTEFENLIKKSEKTIKAIIWHSQHALTYVILTTFCVKILFNEYLFFKKKENNEPISKKDLFFSLLMILLASKGLLYSLEKLNNNK